jgi:phage-related protein
MPIIGNACHELRVQDAGVTWRIICSVHADAIVILEVFEKKTTKTPKSVVRACDKRL